MGQFKLRDDGRVEAISARDIYGAICSRTLKDLSPEINRFCVANKVRAVTGLDGDPRYITVDGRAYDISNMILIQKGMSGGFVVFDKETFYEKYEAVNE